MKLKLKGFIHDIIPHSLIFKGRVSLIYSKLELKTEVLKQLLHLNSCY